MSRNRFAMELKSYEDFEQARILTFIKKAEPRVFNPSLHWHDEPINRVPSLLRVERNLHYGKYAGKPWKFIRKAHEAFQWIKSNFHARSNIHKAAEAMEDFFVKEMDNLMIKIGYCCGRWYVIKPRNVECTARNGCLIEPYGGFYRYKEWTYCEPCLNRVPENFVVDGDALQIQKKQFTKYVFVPSKVEDFVKCVKCKRKNHEMCVGHIRLCLTKFICKKCSKLDNIQTFRPRAWMLPTSECDLFVSRFLESQGIRDLTVRLLSDIEKNATVKNNFSNYRESFYDFTFRHCSLYTFFDTGQNADTCFFSVFFQVYDDKCPPENRNSAYISYIDSVNVFPSKFRTRVYRLILLGLFGFFKVKGYSKVFLWSCPPKKSQDYIFPVKPPSMKIPSKQRLSTWYRELLKLGLELGVIESYQGILQHAQNENWTLLKQIPYLEGDLWVTRMDEVIIQVDREYKKLQALVQTLMKKDVEYRKNGYSLEKAQDNANMLARKLIELREFDLQQRMWELIMVQIDHFKSEYFVIKLKSEDLNHNKERSNQQPLSLIKYPEWLGDRSDFIDFFCGLMLEFSSERRALYATTVMLARIFLELSFCINCRKVCPDGVTKVFLCIDCYYNDVNVNQVVKKGDVGRKIPEIRLLRCDSQNYSSLRSDSTNGMASHSKTLRAIMPITSSSSSKSTDRFENLSGETSKRCEKKRHRVEESKPARKVPRLIDVIEISDDEIRNIRN